MTDDHPISLKIGMIDVDLLNNGTRHPNLAQMKMSSYCKTKGHSVKLIHSDNELKRLKEYDFLLVSKVFNFTPVPKELLSIMKMKTSVIKPEKTRYKSLNDPSIVDKLRYYSEVIRKKPNSTQVLIGGTGFFENGGRNLDDEIEKIMPDYELYSEYVEEKISSGREESYYNNYRGCSIGFLTRGCFRKCSFCVNKKYDHAFVNTDDIYSFHKPENKIIYLWDDNFLSIGRKKALELLDKLIEVDTPFQFRQGLDLRLITEDISEKFQQCRYHGDFIFAFDHIQDKEIIIKKLAIWRKYCKKETKLYVLCGYDARSNDIKYGINEDIPVEKKDLIDIENTFERIHILMKFGCLPYIMRYISYKDSPYKGIYTQLARWCNQPSHYKRMSFEEFCIRNQDYVQTKKPCAAMRALNLLKQDAPHIYEKYAKCKFMYGGEEEGEIINT